MVVFNDFSDPYEDSFAYALSSVKLMTDLDKNELTQGVFLSKVLEKLETYPKSEALLYYSVKFLFKLEKYDIIRSFLVEYLKKEHDCRWAWTFLGKTLRHLDECLAIACICQAMLLPKHQEFRSETNIELILTVLKLSRFTYCYRLMSKSFYEDGAPLAGDALDLKSKADEDVFAKVI